MQVVTEIIYLCHLENGLRHKMAKSFTNKRHWINLQKIKYHAQEWLTESFFKDDCNFLSSVVAVLWTTFFFLLAVPLPPIRTWAWSCFNFSWFIVYKCSADEKNKAYNIINGSCYAAPRARGGNNKAFYKLARFFIKIKGASPKTVRYRRLN